MENIGFGIMCFGKDFYFKGTQEKLKNILEMGYRCYVLTDNPEYFFTKFWGKKIEIIPYERNFKSYYDKVSLVKRIHKSHEIAILMDADLHIINYDVLDKLRKYDFNSGVSYIETLQNHPSKFSVIGDIPMIGGEWLEYNKYLTYHHPNFKSYSTIWEYFMVFNKNGFKSDDFFNYYEKLQIIKEFCDINYNKEISGAGEGVSITMSCVENSINVGLDKRLSLLLKNYVKPITRHTPTAEIPNYLR